MLDFDFESSLAQLIPSGTADAHERIRSVLHRKDALESGQIDPAGFADWALSILGSDATREQFYQAWQQIFTRNASMWQCVRQLAADNHNLILISN
ncbi:MAG: hypothetical protein LZF85_08465, partial [Nitrosomonas sp.]|uniref:hypothetical protein n=1 Tax=Nitrosomonas sp. TaxID=42353 RepID=UPI0025CF6F02